MHVLFKLKYINKIYIYIYSSKFKYSYILVYKNKHVVMYNTNNEIRVKDTKRERGSRGVS